MVKTQRSNVPIAQPDNSLIQLLSNANAALVTGIFFRNNYEMPKLIFIIFEITHENR